MASITIRSLDPVTMARLRAQAAAHGRSMAEEACAILRSVLDQEAPAPGNLVDAIRARFAPLGGFDMPDPSRDPIRKPPGLSQ